MPRLDTSRQEIEHHKWRGIQSYKNFEFLRVGVHVRVWKAYGIGKGKLIRNQELRNRENLV